MKSGRSIQDVSREILRQQEAKADYLERESGWLAQSGIFITDAAIADADAADPKEAYLVYLARFAFEHLGDGNIYPLPYEQWRSM